MTTTSFALAALLMTAAAGCVTQPESEPDADELSTATQELKAGATCRIDGVTFAAGALDPVDSCASCQPQVTKKAWTVLDAACYEPPPPPEPTACESPRDCNALACIDGLCAACTMDSQCAAPLRCWDGGCVL